MLFLLCWKAGENLEGKELLSVKLTYEPQAGLDLETDQVGAMLISGKVYLKNQQTQTQNIPKPLIKDWTGRYIHIVHAEQSASPFPSVHIHSLRTKIVGWVWGKEFQWTRSPAFTETAHTVPNIVFLFQNSDPLVICERHAHLLLASVEPVPLSGLVTGPSVKATGFWCLLERGRCLSSRSSIHLLMISDFGNNRQQHPIRLKALHGFFFALWEFCSNSTVVSRV